jgi:hypothetical protein
LEKRSAFGLAQVGFIVGRPQPGGKDLLLRLIPTPSSETGPAARLDGPSHMTLDLDWVVEHGCQLAEILVGGGVPGARPCVIP